MTSNKVVKYNCTVEKDDYAEFDAIGNIMSIDIYNYELDELGEKKEINTAILMSKTDVKKLIKYLQDNVDSLDERYDG